MYDREMKGEMKREKREMKHERMEKDQSPRERIGKEGLINVTLEGSGRNTYPKNEALCELGY